MELSGLQGFNYPDDEDDDCNETKKKFNKNNNGIFVVKLNTEL